MKNIIGYLNLLDIIIILLFFTVIIAITIYYTKKAGKDLNQFFLSGRNLPWYLAGTAMVATTFAADTPLAVTELVAKNGIAGNWLWWNMAIGGLLTVFFFAKLWRRSGILTDVEFLEFRYSGKSAAFLRGFRAIYLGLLMNMIILGWVHEAMEKIFRITFPGLDAFAMVAIVAVIIGIYASASGLLGTIRTDSFQFIFALAGCIILAVMVVRIPQIGSMKNLQAQLPEQTLNFFPKIKSLSMMDGVNGILTIPFGAFVAYTLVQWWASWYPGADPGGGGYIAQRIMSAKDEKNSLLATLWFNIAHYTLRPWPWIIVALAALVVLPRANSEEELKSENLSFYNISVAIDNDSPLSDNQKQIVETQNFEQFYDKYENTVDPGVMYPKLMIKYLPSGVLGLLIAVFLAAYMSTIAAQLNWGTSYIVSDFYKRFINKNKSNNHYVIISRLTIMLLVILSLVLSKYLLHSISGAWEFIINASAGLGTVLILRWYWWRINAWSEIAAMIAPIIFYPIAKNVLHLEAPMTLFPTVLGSTIVWLIVTYFTKPVEDKKLEVFYKRVHPGGWGWRKFKKLYPEVQNDTQYGKQFLNWFLGVIAIYATMYGFGKVLFNDLIKGFGALILASVAFYIISLNLRSKKTSL